MKSNIFVCYVPYLRNNKAYGHDFCYTCKWWCLQVFLFQFFKTLIFWVVRGLKVQKMVQNDKKFCLLHSISEEPCIIWLSFMFLKWQYLQGFIIQSLIFGVHKWVKGQKTVRNDKKFCLLLYISGTIHQKIVIYCANV